VQSVDNPSLYYSEVTMGEHSSDSHPIHSFRSFTVELRVYNSCLPLVEITSPVGETTCTSGIPATPNLRDRSRMIEEAKGKNSQSDWIDRYSFISFSDRSEDTKTTSTWERIDRASS
ncbi:hypothetical protein PENTCL1PPCAC_6550, partial [Pristionchus entomophagus]